MIGRKTVEDINGDSLEAMNKLRGVLEGLGYRQFGIGYNEVDGIKAQKYMSEATNLVLSIMVNKKENTKANAFFHYLLHEEWFELEQIDILEEYLYDFNQKLKISSKDLEPPLAQDQRTLIQDEEIIEIQENQQKNDQSLIDRLYGKQETEQEQKEKEEQKK